MGAGGENLAEIRDVGGVGVRYGEVERAEGGSHGHLVFDGVRGFGAVFASQDDVDCEFLAGANAAAGGGERVDRQGLPSIDGLDTESHVLQLQRIEAALHHVGYWDCGGERDLHGHAVVGGKDIVDLHRSGGVLQIDL